MRHSRCSTIILQQCFTHDSSNSAALATVRLKEEVFQATVPSSARFVSILLSCDNKNPVS